MKPTAIIGIDCAVDPKNVGLAKGVYSGDLFVVIDARCGRSEGDLISVLSGWIQSESRVLLALDAPLGWPSSLGRTLVGHAAGAPLSELADKLFRRETDRLINDRCNKRPLDVGADRIARTAHAALNLLDDLGTAIGQRIPLAWDNAFSSRIAAIEVYPAATLSGRGIRCSQYKKTEHTEERRDIASKLNEHLTCSVDHDLLVADADVLDAVVCSLAGLDFLRGLALAPLEPELARNEGWIWAKLPGQ